MSNKKVRVAIIGVGNCASSFVQGIYHYAGITQSVPGIMHNNIGGYALDDIEFTFGVDINASKVGKDLSEAILAKPNNTIAFQNVPHMNVPVVMGKQLDSIGKYHMIEVSKEKVANIVKLLQDTSTDVVVNYLPVGSTIATEWYVNQALEAGCAFVNCIPVFIASDPYWQNRFEEAGLPVLGDDIKSQVGATIVHRVLARLFEERGVHIERTYQLNFGGNSDFMNMLERDRLESKKISKTNAVTSQIPHAIMSENVHVGPSDYVPWLTDRKWAHIRIEGTTFGGVPLNVELKLEVWDSPNSAGVVIDAVRCAKLALDRKLAGAIKYPSSYFFKSPPVQFSDELARELTEKFISP